MQLKVLLGDITKWPADAIVNSANTTLLGSGGVDRNIHIAGGLSLTAACRALHGCRVGDAKVTYGYHLPVKYVIHTVGPMWFGGKRSEDTVLVSCYKKSLELAQEKKLKHLALTSISTQQNRIPLAREASIAIPLLMEKGQKFERIDIICPDKEMQNIYTKAVVAFWLEHLVSASKSELSELADEAVSSLVLLHIIEEETDPLVISKNVRNMKALLKPFLDGTTPCSLIDMDRVTDKIMTHAYC